jgi:sugar O-acyltransferase (sialic acid O-acetyltransferase NeuD family)
MHDTFATRDAPRPLIIVGAGGHGLEVLWVAARMSLDPIFGSWNVLGFVDDRSSLRGRMIEGVPVLGSVDEFLAANQGKPWFFHCAMGSNLQRQKLAGQFEAAGFQAATIMDPATVLSPRATLGPGCYVAPRCYIGPHAVIGRHVLINVSASIGHHSAMGDYAQACPGVRVNGHCQIGRIAFLGSNAVVHLGKRVGENSTVAAGSFVVRDVSPHTLVVGVPAVAVHHSPSFEAESAGQEDPLTPMSPLKTPVE